MARSGRVFLRDIISEIRIAMGNVLTYPVCGKTG